MGEAETLPRHTHCTGAQGGGGSVCAGEVQVTEANDRNGRHVRGFPALCQPPVYQRVRPRGQESSIPYAALYTEGNHGGLAREVPRGIRHHLFTQGVLVHAFFLYSEVILFFTFHCHWCGRMGWVVLNILMSLLFSLQLRTSNDMQFSFSYMYYLMSMKKTPDLEEFFHELDLDNSG